MVIGELPESDAMEPFHYEDYVTPVKEAKHYQLYAVLARRSIVGNNGKLKKFVRKGQKHVQAKRILQMDPLACTKGAQATDTLVLTHARKRPRNSDAGTATDAEAAATSDATTADAAAAAVGTAPAGTGGGAAAVPSVAAAAAAATAADRAATAADAAAAAIPEPGDAQAAPQEVIVKEERKTTAPDQVCRLIHRPM